MINNPEHKKIFWNAAGISLLLHGAFLIVTFFILVAGYSFSQDETAPLVRIRVETRDMSSPPGSLQQPVPVDKRTNELEPTPIDQKAQWLPRQPSMAQPESREELIESDKSSLKVIKEEGPEPLKRSVQEGRRVQKRLVMTEQAFKDFTVTSSNVLNPSDQIPEPVAYGVSSLTAGNLKGITSSGDAGILSAHNKNMLVPFERKTQPQDIQAFLGYELLTYEDPQDHSKYFKLSIRVEDTPVTLPTIPKEIVFLIDASNSIGQERLDQFKKGLQECLNQLGFQDKFNVMIFKKTVVKYMQQSVERNPTNIGNALEFLKGFTPGSRTDVYDAVLKSIELKDPMKPAYLMLLSDGQATEGVTNPQQIINQIAGKNQGKVPVFAFGGGVYVDEYLLEFLSFTNRGWTEFSPKSFQISKRLLEMYNHIKEPVLLDLRYYVSGLSEKDIYPKLLPDFFRGSQFVLYGRYSDEESFYLQLAGDAQSGVKQYLITDNIAKAPKGDENIARQWAFRKVYHLVGDLEFDKDNPAVLEEIKNLTRKFNLKTPFVDKKK